MDIHPLGILSLSPVVHRGKAQHVTGNAQLTRLPRQCGPPAPTGPHHPSTVMGTAASEQPSSLAIPYSVSGISVAIPLSPPEEGLWFVLRFLSRTFFFSSSASLMCGHMSHFIIHRLHPMLTERVWTWATINILLFPFTCLTSFRASLFQSGVWL